MKNGTTTTEVSVEQSISDVLSPLSICMHVRGAARTDGRVMREATALVESGFAVSILDMEQDYTRPTQEDVAHVRLIHTFVSKSSFVVRFRSVLLLMKLIEHFSLAYKLTRIPADVYHAHDWMALPACYLAARLRRKALIFDAHELPLAELTDTRWSRFKSPLTLMIRMMVRYCSATITVSPPIIQEVQDRFHAHNLVLVRNVHRYQTTLPSNRLRQLLNLDSATRIALYQGNIQGDRGLHVLVQVAKFLEPNIVIVMMGRGIGETATQLEALALDEGVAERIKIVPPVAYSELLEWTTSADVGLILYPPNHSLNVKMCLPNKLFEYVMAGLPILATQLDAVSEILQQYRIGRVIPSLTPFTIATDINRLLADTEALAAMRRSALEAAQGDLCWETEQQQLIAVYTKFLQHT